MIKNYINLVRLKGWINLLAVVAMVAIGTRGNAQGGGGQGNTTIHDSGEMVIFGNYDFNLGGGGTQKGIVLTQRSTGTLSKLSFKGDNLTTTGADNLNYVDGYVKKYGLGQFIFPVGDNDFLGLFAAYASSTEGTQGAYFHANPNSAVTTDRFTAGNYPPLPAGAPFSTVNRGVNVGTVSLIEYWDIDGTVPTPITLTWDAGSTIATITSNNISSLRIVGWNPVSAQWEMIPSTYDPVSTVLGGITSTTTVGSITTIGNIIPDTYTAYTFAQVELPDLTPAQLFSDTQLSVGESVDYAVIISNVGPETTTAPIVFKVTNYGSASGLTMTLSPNATMTFPPDTYPLANANFSVTSNPSQFTFTSIGSFAIPAGGYITVGFKLTRTGGVNGIVNNTVTITNGTGGGEFPTNNNTIANPITKL